MEKLEQFVAGRYFSLTVSTLFLLIGIFSASVYWGIIAIWVLLVERSVSRG